MPSRILREGILTSEAVNKLSVEAELFYRRLYSVVDDYGRFFAHPQLLIANCYPLRFDSVTPVMIEGWLDECKAAGVIIHYAENGKFFVEITKFDQQIRIKRPKFPCPNGLQKHA